MHSLYPLFRLTEPLNSSDFGLCAVGTDERDHRLIVDFDAIHSTSIN
jgi:hypothetical protein